ncbi:3'-5' exonuclease [Arcanobacterium hippocoleae]
MYACSFAETGRSRFFAAEYVPLNSAISENRNLPAIDFSNPLAVVDVETTGLNPRHDRIVEIGVILFNKHLQVEGKFSALVNPRRDTGAVFVHGIRNEDIADAPFFEDIQLKLAQILKKRIIVAHNAAFDISFLNAEFARSGNDLRLKLSQSICTMNQSRIYCPPGSHSLKNLVVRLGIKYQPKHRALADAQAAAALLQTYVSSELIGQRFTNIAFDRTGKKVLPSEHIIQACTPKLFFNDYRDITGAEKNRIDSKSSGKSIFRIC